MRIVINRTDAIGDTLLTLPMAKLIKEKYPNAEVIFWISEKSKDLFEFCPWIDKIWVMDRDAFWWNRMIHALKLVMGNKIDAYFFIAGSHFPSFFSWLKRIRFRGGLRSKWQSFVFLNKSVRQKRSLVEMHESDYNLLLLEKFGIDFKSINRENYRPLFQIPFNEIVRAKDDFKAAVVDNQKKWKEEFIVIHPGMVGHTLNWSMNNYARLIVRMEETWPSRFLFMISYTQSDMGYIKKIQKYFMGDEYTSINKKIYYYDGGVKGLSEYIKVLKNAALFVGPSTGTTHLANSLDIAQIGIYSPIKVQSAMRWGPFTRSEGKCHILVPDVVCGEHFSCALESCSYYKCMAKIEVEDVLSLSKELLN